MQTINLYSLLDKKFIGADDLRRDLTKILDHISQNKEIVVTQHGKPKGVLVDIETYMRIEELKDELADYNPKLVKRVNAALADAKAGNVEDMDEAFKKLGI